MQSSDTQKMFSSSHYDMAASQGPVIGLEYNGKDSIKHCQEILIDVSRGSTGLVYFSTNPKTATYQIELFYSFANMQI